MKKSLTLSLFVLSLFSAVACAADKAWLTDYEEALAKAKAEDKVLLIEFHGSDWCPPCIKLNQEVLTKDEFKAYAKESLVLLNVDFPRKTALSDEQRSHNEALAEKFGLQGVPMVVLLDGEGNILDKNVGFPRGGLDGFMDFVKSAAE